MQLQDTTPFTSPSSLAYSPYAEALVERPRGKKRTDKSIREEIYETLSTHTQICADDIHVTVQDGDVFLIGSVPCREMKPLAETVANRCFGIRDVLNQLEERA